MRTTLFWQLLLELLKAKSVKAATDCLKLPFALETIYSLLRRLRLRLTSLRPLLASKQPAPLAQEGERDPLWQTLRHLHTFFREEAGRNPVSEFQLRFGTAFLD